MDRMMKQGKMDTHPLANLVNIILFSVLYWINRRRARLRRAPKKILVVKIDGIGDLVLFGACLKQLRDLYKRNKLYLVVSKEVASLAAACPYIDEVMPFDKALLDDSRWQRLALLMRLWGKGFDVAVNAHYSRKLWTDRLIRYSFAQRRVGFLSLDNEDGSLLVRRNYEQLYTDLIDVKEPMLFEGAKFAALVTHLGSDDVAADEPSFHFAIRTEDESRAIRFLEEHALLPQGQRKVVVVFPGSAWAGRQWPLERHAATLNALAGRYELSFLLCGSAKERRTLENLAGLLHQPAVLSAGELSLPQIAAVMKGASLYVGNDTGPLHMALALHVPALFPLGGGHFGRFLPYSEYALAVYRKMDCYHCGWNCIYDEIRCITSIEVEDALNVAVARLEGQFGWRPRQLADSMQQRESQQ